MANKKQIEQYNHSDKERTNNPQVGLVTPVSDPDTGEKKNLPIRPAPRPATAMGWQGGTYQL